MLRLNRLCLPVCQISPFLIRPAWAGGHLPPGKARCCRAGLEKGKAAALGAGKTSVISFLGVL